MSALADALAAGTIADRVWFYANYHCNLQCSYCLTESAPLVKRRELGREAILARAREAKDLGFGAYGVTGGEPFILDYMPELIAELSTCPAARRAGRPPDVSYCAGVDQRTRIRLTKYSTKAG